MKPVRKVTVRLPSELLKEAREFTGKGITETIRQGLALLVTNSAYNVLQHHRGKYRSSISLNDLRKDRR